MHTYIHLFCNDYFILFSVCIRDKFLKVHFNIYKYFIKKGMQLVFKNTIIHSLVMLLSGDLFTGVDGSGLCGVCSRTTNLYLDRCMRLNRWYKVGLQRIKTLRLQHWRVRCTQCTVSNRHSEYFYVDRMVQIRLFKGMYFIINCILYSYLIISVYIRVHYTYYTI